ncbi:alanine racemase [Gemmiger sp. An194]|uniref:alanine racemase n=1 Tax=Gemmiger sp. An194 TaxID=1965582 RepID=UPI000B373848|nr:alanine racemase [Gemmiger sp. An194]OUP23667.1 alanine racemase [Gemmiger sp. An194]
MNFEKHCWAEVDLDALAHNFRLLQQHAGFAAVCAVVKAGAYGHGDGIVCRTLADAGAKWFAVSCLAEALHLRSGGVTGEILILGHTDPTCAATLACHRLTQAVFSPEYARVLSSAALEAGARVRCHLKIDTGMGRLGFIARCEEDIPACLDQLEACFGLEGLEITGMFQHFAVADSHAAADVEYTNRQHSLFVQVKESLEARGHKLRTVHCCNSAALVEHPEWGMDLVRPGIVLYGCDPSDEVHLDGLRPVLTLKTVVSQVKELLPGQALSYGLQFTADAPRKVATLCVGYADGYPRLLSGKGVCSIGGHAAPVLGRVCMDQMMVDVTGLDNVQEGDEAVVFGGPGADSLNDVANKVGSIPYEIMCGLALRVPRVYLREGRCVAIADYLKQM